MVKGLVIAALVLPLLGACALAPLGFMPCNVGPIRPDSGWATRWTRDEKEQAVVLNETGEKYCGWRP